MTMGKCSAKSDKSGYTASTSNYRVWANYKSGVRSRMGVKGARYTPSDDHSSSTSATAVYAHRRPIAEV